MSNLQIGQMGSRPSPTRLDKVSLAGEVPAAAGAGRPGSVVALRGWPLGASNNEHILKTLKRRSGERRQRPSGAEDGEGLGMAFVEVGGEHNGHAELKMGTIGGRAAGAESGPPSVEPSGDGGAPSDATPPDATPPGKGGVPAAAHPLLPSPPTTLLLADKGGGCRSKLPSGGGGPLPLPLPLPPSWSL